jgi:hypothetical protein
MGRETEGWDGAAERCVEVTSRGRASGVQGVTRVSLESAHYFTVRRLQMIYRPRDWARRLRTVPRARVAMGTRAGWDIDGRHVRIAG